LTRNTNARAAGAAFLIYIAAGMAGTAGRWPLPVSVMLAFTECFCAFVLAVTLHALTRGVDRDVASFGLVCRVAEGILGAMWISTAVAIHTAPPSGESAGFVAVVALSRSARSLNVGVGGTCFAAGSLAFCWLLLRGRIIPTALAWIGIVASVQLLVMLPLQLAGVVAPSMLLLWLPMLAFEVPVALWFLARGVPFAHLDAAPPHSVG
jgi:hypothetical protein